MLDRMAHITPPSSPSSARAAASRTSRAGILPKPDTRALEPTG